MANRLPARHRPGATAAAPARLSATLRATVDYIAGVQEDDGSIPWEPGGTLDPWDHVEAAMGLTIGGEYDRAAAAYNWLRRHQLPEGGWYAAYRDGAIEDGTRFETNFVAYVATGVWHHFRVTSDRTFLVRMWPMVERAMNFVCSMQAATGEIWWALDTRTGIDKDALVTGCSSIFKSFECALHIACVLGHERPVWRRARTRLGACLRARPDRFDRTWASKSRYSMDWFYPVLTGVLSPQEGARRLDAKRQCFVVDGLGCRCVADSDWVTVAESCELCLALNACGRRDEALQILAWLQGQRTEDGAFWTGFAFEADAGAPSLQAGVFWPDERPTWTAGAVLLAADALYELTAAATLFTPASFTATAALESASARPHRDRG